MLSATLGAMPITLRALRPSEHNLVYSSWIRHGAEQRLAKLMSRRTYAEDQHRTIEALLESASFLAADLEGTVIGWACTDEATVHYVFVKEGYRRRGLARLLVAPFIGRVTRVTSEPPQRELEWYARKLPSTWIYGPLAAVQMPCHHDPYEHHGEDT